ncbi:hypothetical protein, partial [Staphylococcus aureus]|uniref:hypothetical protein n=1 Tax=Staphylococcus aureus TaxID=1280 RepID=UPI0039BE289B
IDVPGAGTAGGILTANVTNISSDGKTLTLDTNASTTLSNVSKTLNMYHKQFGYVTNVAATVAGTTTGSASFNFYQRGSFVSLRVMGSEVSLGQIPVFEGYMERFGGYYQPKISLGSGGSATGRWGTDSVTNLPFSTQSMP